MRRRATARQLPEIRSIPHPIPYQGSKRAIADLILSCAPQTIETLYEPFAGSAAVTLAAARAGRANRYIIGDSLTPLAEAWNEIIDRPEYLSAAYADLWNAQTDSPRDHYLSVRTEFNQTPCPVRLLYLLARCVKNAVRFNGAGEFNQSADHRRSGVRPERMRKHIFGAHALLTGRAMAVCADYGDLTRSATSTDFVYLDPPFQGVSGASDTRYYRQLEFDRLVSDLNDLNRRGVPYILSFDGSCGERAYGDPLPAELDLTQILVPTGRSSQATLNGRTDVTTESLYLSPTISTGRPLDSRSLVRNG